MSALFIIPTSVFSLYLYYRLPKDSDQRISPSTTKFDPISPELGNVTISTMVGDEMAPTSSTTYPSRAHPPTTHPSTAYYPSTTSPSTAYLSRAYPSTTSPSTAYPSRAYPSMTSPPHSLNEERASPGCFGGKTTRTRRESSRAHPSTTRPHSLNEGIGSPGCFASWRGFRKQRDF